MDYTIESFMNYCDEMYIANESFSSIKSKIVELFSKLVLWIDKKVKSMKDSKVKSVLTKLLNRAKQGLSKSKSLNEHNPEMVKMLQEEAEEIKEEVEKVEEMKDDGSKSNATKPNGEKIYYDENGKTIDYIVKPNGEEIWYKHDGKTIWYIKKPNGVKIWYNDILL